MPFQPKFDFIEAIAVDVIYDDVSGETKVV